MLRSVVEFDPHERWGTGLIARRPFRTFLKSTHTKKCNFRRKGRFSMNSKSCTSEVLAQLCSYEGEGSFEGIQIKKSNGNSEASLLLLSMSSSKRLCSLASRCENEFSCPIARGMAILDFDAQMLQLSRGGVRGVLFQSPGVLLVVKGWRLTFIDQRAYTL